MTGRAANQITLLLFSLEGVRFGVEAGQVLATSAYGGERGAELFWLHERIGFGATAVYRVPTVITVGARGGVLRRVIIDGIEEIADFAIEELRPLPAAVEPFCLRRGMWGVIPGHSGVILLLDFLILFGDQTIPPTPSTNTQAGDTHETDHETDPGEHGDRHAGGGDHEQLHLFGHPRRDRDPGERLPGKDTQDLLEVPAQ